MIHGGGEVCSPEVLTGSDEERSAWSSPEYGTRVPARSLRFRREFVGQCALIACFSTSNRMIPSLMEQDGAIRIGMRTGEGTREILFYRVRTDWPHGTEGIYFDGKILYRRAARLFMAAHHAGKTVSVGNANTRKFEIGCFLDHLLGMRGAAQE